MAHARKQIRDAIETLLIAAAASGTSVKASRAWPTNQSDLPRYNLYTTNDDADDQFSTMSSDARALTAVVDILDVGSETTLQDTMDAHSVIVEKALIGQKLSGLVQDLSLVTTTLAISNEGETPLGVATLTFTIMYRTLRGDPESIQ